MFNQPIDERLTEWINHRQQLETAIDPLQDVWDFWHASPFTPHNRNVDPYFQKSWPSPWEIIECNKYDDFTRALMIAWTLKLTTKFKNAKIEIRTLVDKVYSKQYNLVCIDDMWIINYSDNGPALFSELDDSLRLENLIEIHTPR